jgi:hypothetical protein
MVQMIAADKKLKAIKYRRPESFFLITVKTILSKTNRISDCQTECMIDHPITLNTPVFNHSISFIKLFFIFFQIVNQFYQFVDIFIAGCIAKRMERQAGIGTVKKFIEQFFYVAISYCGFLHQRIIYMDLLNYFPGDQFFGCHLLHGLQR